MNIMYITIRYVHYFNDTLINIKNQLHFLGYNLTDV